MPEPPRLKVLASGLHQLGTKCAKVSGELATAAKPPGADLSGWASSAATASTAGERAGEDLGGIGTRIGTWATAYNKAGTMYAETEDESAAKLRKLAP